MRGVVVSGDKDLAQLLDGEDEQWDYARNERWNVHGVKARYGVHAHQVADYLGLTGDAIDNIPGVPGIGAKTAAGLLEHFGSLDALLERIAEVPYLRLRGSAAHCRAPARAPRDRAAVAPTGPPSPAMRRYRRISTTRRASRLMPRRWIHWWSAALRTDDAAPPGYGPAAWECRHELRTRRRPAGNRMAGQVAAHDATRQLGVRRAHQRRGHVGGDRGVNARAQAAVRRADARADSK
jgi:hypothetical protein